MTSCVRNVHTSPRTPVNLVVPSDNKFHYDKSTEFVLPYDTRISHTKLSGRLVKTSSLWSLIFGSLGSQAVHYGSVKPADFVFA